MAFWLQNTISIIGFIGSIASCIGLWYSYTQLKKMTDATQAATKATQQAVAKLNREYSIAELARYTEIFQRARICIYTDNYQQASHIFSDIRFKTQDLVHVPPLSVHIDSQFVKTVLRSIDGDIIILGHHNYDNPMPQPDKDRLYKHINDLAVHLKDVEGKLKYASQNV